jgi:hypothetical protein
MLGTGLVLLGLNANWPELVEGAIIIIVVTIGLGINKGGKGAKRKGYGGALRFLGTRRGAVPAAGQQQVATWEVAARAKDS